MKRSNDATNRVWTPQRPDLPSSGKIRQDQEASSPSEEANGVTLAIPRAAASDPRLVAGLPFASSAAAVTPGPAMDLQHEVEQLSGATLQMDAATSALFDAGFGAGGQAELEEKDNAAAAAEKERREEEAAMLAEQGRQTEQGRRDAEERRAIEAKRFHEEQEAARRIEELRKRDQETGKNQRGLAFRRAARPGFRRSESAGRGGKPAFG